MIVLCTNKIVEYFKRTEYLREVLHCKKASHHSTLQSLQLFGIIHLLVWSTMSVCYFILLKLEKSKTDFPELLAASLKASDAENQIKCKNYAAALELYKEAVAILMPHVKSKMCIVIR